MFPADPIHDWVEEQHRYGIWLLLIRESTLEAEPDLISDFGIYGSRAVGMQLLDPAGRTKRFVLSFDFEGRRASRTNVATPIGLRRFLPKPPRTPALSEYLSSRR